MLTQIISIILNIVGLTIIMDQVLLMHLSKLVENFCEITVLSPGSKGALIVYLANSFDILVSCHFPI